MAEELSVASCELLLLKSGQVRVQLQRYPTTCHVWEYSEFPDAELSEMPLQDETLHTATNTNFLGNYLLFQ
ncbi:MAG: hypothetical protein LBS75_05920, partial [Synergistaceae bacterium]|nr:hypothetical protein [Synergistaceae bacterium]